MKNNWPVKKLGELVENVTKGTTPTTYGFNYSNQGTAFLRAEDINNNSFGVPNTHYFIDEKTNDFLERSKTQANDVLITIAGTIGRVAIVDSSAPTMNMNQAVALIRPNNENINPKYLYYLLQSKHVQLQIGIGQVTGTLTNLSLTQIKELKIPLPTISNQRKIVERLDAIRKAQELCDQQIQKTEELFKSLLNEEFRNSASWQSKKIKDVAIEVVTGKTPSTSKKDFFIPEVNFATPADFDGSNLWIQETKRKISKKAIEEKAARIVPENSLMIICIGATIGKIALSKIEMSTNQQINSIIFNTNLIIPEFALLYFIRDKKLITKQAKQTTLPILNKTLTEELEILIPDLGIQKKIVEKLEAVQNYKKLLQKEKALLKELFDSVLDKCMKGEIVN